MTRILRFICLICLHLMKALALITAATGISLFIVHLMLIVVNWMNGRRWDQSSSLGILECLFALLCVGMVMLIIGGTFAWIGYAWNKSAEQYSKQKGRRS